MELKNLQKHVRTLAILPETDAPVISCYLTLHNGRIKDRNAFDGQVRPLIGGLTGQMRQDFEDALEPIGQYLAVELLPEAQGIAIFSRAGGDPSFLPLQFRVPLPNWMAVDTTPNIYHLVELKDTYHRYVVMISTEESVRIYGVNLGAVTEQLYKQRPELRERVGREWTKEHYQNHRRDRAQKFFKEQIDILDRVMSKGGYTHLVLAGHPTSTSRVRSELPKHLAEKLIDVVTISAKTFVSDVVKAALASFIEQEEKESRAAAEEIERQIQTGGLAVIGTEASLHALRRDQVDTLVMARSYSPDPGWRCAACGLMGSQTERPGACTECGASELQDFDIREMAVRLAEQQGCSVEVVNQSEPLTRFGGVGCLLRYRLPDEYAQCNA
ncbi:MAG: hypothetical protein ISR77_12280 [Pirellulaceae bacterium]|nr:hypothetical protein [Pirellulaceae bacterium]